MCGLIAVINRNSNRVEKRRLSIARDTMTHRGPDDSGMFVEKNVGLGFRRLSIQDLSPLGHQPMESRDGELVIVFNGEIFNFIELRSELSGHGYTFRSSSDTEVLLAAYQHWGDDCVNHLNGMWAFLIFHRRLGRVFGSRDRYGIKPLYYFENADEFVFASEIKAIRNYCGTAFSVNSVTTGCFMVSNRLDDSPSTFFDGIYQLPPGHSFRIEPGGSFSLKRYYSLPQTVADSTANPEEYAELFNNAVKIRLRSDVAVGVTLSGGLDSSSIICAMAKNLRDTSTLNAFSFTEPGYDESRFLNDTIAQTGANMFSDRLQPRKLWDTLDHVLHIHDEPLHSMTALVGYELMALARRNGVTVVLGGQGADETLGGYNVYFSAMRQSLLRDRKARLLWKDLTDFAESNSSNPIRLLLQELWIKLKTQIRQHNATGPLLSGPAPQPEMASWLAPEIARSELDRIKVKEQRYGECLEDSLLRSVMESPLPKYLRIEDRNSMGNSVEARLPFLDFRLVDAAFRAPAEWKLRGRWNKYLLREAMKNKIPESVVSRVDKFGFPTPIDEWVRNDLKEPIMDVLASSEFRGMGEFEHRKILSRAQQHMAGEHNHGANLFKIAQFVRWKSTITALGAVGT